jgi:hypothetical protein
MSVLKRQREAKKAEKAAAKRERREHVQESSESKVATKDDLEGYGLGPEPSEDSEPSEHD